MNRIGRAQKTEAGKTPNSVLLGLIFRGCGIVYSRSHGNIIDQKGKVIPLKV